MFMNISNEELGQLLVDNKLLTAQEYEQLIKNVESTNLSLRDELITSNKLTDEQITQAYANKIGWPFQKINLDNLSIEVLNQIPEHIARPYNIIIFKGGIGNNRKHVAIADPNHLKAIEIIQSLFGNSTKIYLAPKSDIMEALNLYRKSSLNSSLNNQPLSFKTKPQFSIPDHEISDQSPIAQTLKIIIEQAVKLQASNIHINPELNEVSVQYRIDGQLKEINRLPLRVSRLLIARIKKLANMIANETSFTQNGFFKTIIDNKIFTIHISTLPTIDGEKVTLRLVADIDQLPSLQDLGIWGQALDNLNEAIMQPSGLVIVTGPGKSGITTTLRSLIWTIKSTNINISSIERTIDMRLNGISQLQLNPKLGISYQSSIQAFINNDTDVIMIDEISDRETANLVIEAVLKGKLVIAGMSAINIFEPILRLLSFGIEPHLLAYSLKAIINQRLTRKLIPDKSIQFRPSEKQLTKIAQDLSKARTKLEILPEAIRNLANRIQHSEKNELILFKPSTAKTSFKGRIGIYEVLKNSSDLQKIITGKDVQSLNYDYFVRHGLSTIEYDGLVKALLGITTIDEILSAIKN